MDAVKFTPELLDHLIGGGALHIRTCWNCHYQTSEKLMICGGCSTAYYCNAFCQQNNWPTHKRQCKRVQGQRKSCRKIDNFALSLTHDKIPESNVGYIIQIKDSIKFFELVDRDLNLTIMPSIPKDFKGRCSTVDENIFVSFAYNTMAEFVSNYGFILYLTDVSEDLAISEQAFLELNKQGKLILVVYAHDLKHYMIRIVDKPTTL